MLRTTLLAVLACSAAQPSAECVATASALCTADGACAAFGIYAGKIQFHGCAITVPNTDWATFVRAPNGTYARVPGVNVDEDACATHPRTADRPCAQASPSASPAPPTPPAHALVNNGVFEAATGESSIVWWGATSSLVLFESIFCGYWGHAGQWDANFTGHSYFRVRDFATGAVIANLSSSVGFGFGSAVVDHETGTFWIFGTVNDRCGHDVLPDKGAVYAFASTDAGLQTWARVKTDVAWRGPNTAVSRVLGAPPGLPPHRFVMITEGATFALNNNADGDLSAGWLTLDHSTFRVPDCPEGCQCPSIKFLPSDRMYYIITGGHNIWLLRSRDLQTWEQPSSRPLIAPSAGDAAVVRAVGNPATIAASDAWFAAEGKNTSTEMLAHLEAWDHNANDADMCCESWAGAAAVTTSFFNWGPSSQGARPSENLTGPSFFQGLATVNVTLDRVLQGFF